MNHICGGTLFLERYYTMKYLKAKNLAPFLNIGS